ncbi:hypothetical protein LCGC14_1468820 [marine sediment metagenome]|uniref:Transposase n=1 Tax=marine sediment metagenome TaxID=412755 RepID=A0A0F9MET5_9ZZZZ
MRVTKLREKFAPIKIEQGTLYKFCPDLPEPKTRDLLVQFSKKEAISNDSYTLSIEAGNTIEIQETHCFECGTRLKKNGFNDRIAILDEGLGIYEFRIHRKHCRNCGEITPDYSKLAPKYANYHENYRRRARQHYMEGLMPSQIKRVFKIDFGIDISKSSIINWVNEVAKPLREMLKITPIPSSGYWGYDEIHMRIGGEKMYTIDTVDVNTRFIPVAKISPNMGRDAGRKVLTEGRKNRALRIEGLIKDCTTNLGGLFKTRSFKHIILQNCLTHVKWAVSKHVKAFTGLSKQSKKPVPKEWRWLLKRFFMLIGSKDETEAYIQLEIIRMTVEKLKGEKISELHTALKQLESWFPKIIAHQRNPNIPTTNNLLEGFQKKYLYYPAFKKSMMTSDGAQRVLDYRVFRHNFGKFPGYIVEMRVRYETYRLLVKETKNHPTLRGAGMFFKAQFKRLDAWFGNYMEVWSQYFAIL